MHTRAGVAKLVGTESNGPVSDVPPTRPEPTRPDPADKNIPAFAQRPPASEPTRDMMPAWETDQFHWPPMAEQLFHQDDIRFLQAGQQLASAARDGLNVLAVTSTYRGEGRSTVAMNLARAAAQAGLQVALIDGDLENPTLATTLGAAMVSAS